MHPQLKQLNSEIKRLEQRINAMTLRERGILFMVILALLFWLASNVVFSSLRSEQQRLEQDVRGRLADLQTLSEQSQAVQQALEQDPEALADARIKQLKQQLTDEEASVAHLVRGLVTPQAMPQLVRDVLAKNRALQVIKLENLPAESLNPASTTGAPAEATPENPAAQVYRHGMRIELRGQYVDIVRYLRALEAMQSKVFWGEVQFQSEEYPVSRVTLLIYTISLNQAWLEV